MKLYFDQPALLWQEGRRSLPEKLAEVKALECKKIFLFKPVPGGMLWNVN